MSQPEVHDLVCELRRTVGLFDGAMNCTTQEAWEEAMQRVRDLRGLLADLRTCDRFPTPHTREEADRLLVDENERAEADLRLLGLGHLLERSEG